MKKTLFALLASLSLYFSANAQVNPKPIEISTQEAESIVQAISKASIIIHRQDISSLKRDSIDLYLFSVAQFVQERQKEATKVDTLKKSPRKKPTNQ